MVASTNDRILTYRVKIDDAGAFLSMKFDSIKKANGHAFDFQDDYLLFGGAKIIENTKSSAFLLNAKQWRPNDVSQAYSWDYKRASLITHPGSGYMCSEINRDNFLMADLADDSNNVVTEYFG